MVINSIITTALLLWGYKSQTNLDRDFSLLGI